MRLFLVCGVCVWGGGSSLEEGWWYLNGEWDPLAVVSRRSSAMRGGVGLLLHGEGSKNNFELGLVSQGPLHFCFWCPQ